MENNTLETFKTGMRVELHPGCDLWMRGARFGDVVKVGRKWVTVHVDATNRNVQFNPKRINPV